MFCTHHLSPGYLSPGDKSPGNLPPDDQSHCAVGWVAWRRNYEASLWCLVVSVCPPNLISCVICPCITAITLCSVWRAPTHPMWAMSPSPLVITVINNTQCPHVLHMVTYHQVTHHVVSCHLVSCHLITYIIVAICWLMWGDHITDRDKVEATDEA